MLATGARPAEVIPSVRSKHVALLKKELDPQACTVTIRTAKLKPNQKPTPPRIIKISKELMDRVMAHAQTTKGPHVFSVNQSLCHLFDRICVRAGLAVAKKVDRKDKRGKKIVIHKTDELGKKITAHSFRHTYASIMARRVSYNPNALKEIMGHRQLKTTDRYIHPRANGEEVEVSEFLASASDEAVDKLGVRAGGKKKAAEVTAAS